MVPTNLQSQMLNDFLWGVFRIAQASRVVKLFSLALWKLKRLVVFFEQNLGHRFEAWFVWNIYCILKSFC